MDVYNVLMMDTSTKHAHGLSISVPRYHNGRAVRLHSLLNYSMRLRHRFFQYYALIQIVFRQRNLTGLDLIGKGRIHECIYLNQTLHEPSTAVRAAQIFARYRPYQILLAPLKIPVTIQTGYEDCLARHWH